MTKAGADMQSTVSLPSYRGNYGRLCLSSYVDQSGMDSAATTPPRKNPHEVLPSWHTGVAYMTARYASDQPQQYHNL